MKPFSNKRSKRRTAYAALLVFAFAISSGIANACLLEGPATHAHGAEHGSEFRHAHTAMTGHSEDGESDEHDSDVPKDACLKLCDDGSKAPIKLQASSDLLDPGMPPVVAIAWDAATPVACTRSEMDDLQPLIAGPPFRVRYSRLAL